MTNLSTLERHAIRRVVVWNYLGDVFASTVLPRLDVVYKRMIMEQSNELIRSLINQVSRNFSIELIKTPAYNRLLEPEHNTALWRAIVIINPGRAGEIKYIRDDIRRANSRLITRLSGSAARLPCDPVLVMPRLPALHVPPEDWAAETLWRPPII